MDILKKMNVKNISLILCWLTISSYIVFGNCLTFNLGNRMPIKVAEIFAFISCVILFIFHAKDILKFNKGNIKLFIWFAIATIPIIFFDYTLSQKIYGLLYSIRIIATICVAIAIVNILKKYEVTQERIINWIINNYLIVVAIGIIQLILFPQAHDFYRIFYRIGVYFPNPDAHIGRLVSTYFDPNYLAACLIIPTVLSLDYYTRTGKTRYILYIILFITTIILTVSRSGIVGVCVALFVYFICTIKIQQRKLKIDRYTIRAFSIMSITAIIFIFLMLFTNVRVFKRILNTSNDPSTYARSEDWLRGISLLSNKQIDSDNEDVENKNKQELNEDGDNEDIENNNKQNQDGNYINSNNNIFFGIGYNMLGFTEANANKALSSAFGNDSSLIVIFIASGLVGSIYFIYLIGSWLINTYKNRDKSAINSPLISIIIVSLVICNFNNLLFYMLWILPVFILLNLNDKETKNYGKKKNNLNIGIDGRALTKNRTGIGTYTHEIIKELNELDNTNTYYIYSNKKIYIDFELRENFRVCQRSSKIGTFWLYFLLPKQLKKDEIDVFWGTQHCLPKRNENTNTIKYVLTVHDLAIEKFKNIGSLYNTLIQKLVLKRSCKNADEIVAVSEATKKDIVDIFKINNKKINTIYEGVNYNNKYDISKEQEKEILKKFGIEDKNYLFFISTIEPRKNIVTLIKAFEVLKEKQENKTLGLILAGGLGWKYQDVLDAIENSKFKDDINLAGYISKEEKECLFKNANCFVYPSLYEGFGLPILEAMSKEAIVVTSNISSIPEVGGDAAIYFNNVYDYSELSERIEMAMIMDEEERNKYINLGKYQVSKFTWEKCANQVMEILKG